MDCADLGRAYYGISRGHALRVMHGRTDSRYTRIGQSKVRKSEASARDIERRIRENNISEDKCLKAVKSHEHECCWCIVGAR